MRARAILGVVVMLGLTGCWTQFRGGPARDGFQPLSTVDAGSVTRLALSWSAAVGSAIDSSATVNEGKTVVGSDDGVLRAYDADGIAGCSGAPVTCTPVWTATTGGAIDASPALFDGRVVVGSDDGTVRAFDAAGAVNCTGTPKTCTPLWTATTGGPVDSSPAVADGRVVVGSDDGKLHAFTTTGTPLWTATTGGPVDSSPAITNGIVVVGSGDGTVAAFDVTGTTNCTGTPKTCTPLWTATTGGAVTASPAVTDDAVTIGSTDGTLRTYSITPAAATTTTVASSANPSVAGTPVTFTASVQSTAGPATGAATFTDNGAPIGMAGVTAGTATFTTGALTAGDHTIRAVFAGNAAFGPSTSPALVQTVDPPGPTLVVDRQSATCTDSGTGTPAAPFCTIGAATAKVDPGGTVSVRSGTYPETVSITRSGTSTSPILVTSAPGATVTVTGGSRGFSLIGASWVTVRGFRIAGTPDDGIRALTSSHVTIEGNDISDAGTPVSGSTAYGIVLNATTASSVVGNVTHDNSDAGIKLVSASDGNTIRGNDSYGNARGYVRAAAGIDVRASTGNTVTANRAHDNEDSGINAWTGTTTGSNRFTNNLAYRNGDHGIDVHNAVDAHVVANTVYGNVDSGIESTTSTRTYIANNVSVDNGIDSPRTSGNIRIDGPSTATAVLNDDLVHLSVSGVMIDWNGTLYSSLAAFRTATGQESRGKQGDPKFVAAGSADFRLLAGSPAIDCADSGATDQPSTDFAGAARFDDPATANTGIGPVTYADRGAFERTG